MPFGIRIINDSGIIQIDDSRPNFVLIAQGSVYVPPKSGVTAGMASVNFAGQTTPAMVFIKPPYGVRISGSNAPFTNEAFKNTFQLFNVETWGVDVEYAIFGNRAEQGDWGGYGMKIRDANGQVCFSTDDVAPRIVGAVEFPAGAGGTYYINPSGGPGRLFFSLSGTGWRSTSNSGASSPWIAEMWCGRINGEYQVDLTIGLSASGPGTKSMGGNRMVMAARVY
ncbi:hypothetical protein GFK26_18565 [Variovorax paradoxus]|uniref:Uncharacterized protein n=1 Tax=Variovorax paradoxus TaxID=34073 RepID=A0A5Q0M4T2_VARPD|nr:hypothetical protein [Variovorax paradoxus]QFZ84631.1 hypothetical protein GFK26_18565 [Variovorax paradoxus]